MSAPHNQGSYWQPVKVKVAAVTLLPAVTASGAFVLVWLVCMSEWRQSSVLDEPGANASASTV